MPDDTTSTTTTRPLRPLDPGSHDVTHPCPECGDTRAATFRPGALVCRSCCRVFRQDEKPAELDEAFQAASVGNPFRQPVVPIETARARRQTLLEEASETILDQAEGSPQLTVAEVRVYVRFLREGEKDGGGGGAGPGVALNVRLLEHLKKRLGEVRTAPFVELLRVLIGEVVVTPPAPDALGVVSVLHGAGRRGKDAIAASLATARAAPPQPGRTDGSPGSGGDSDGAA